MKTADKMYIFWKIFNLALFIESQGDMIHRYHAKDKPVFDFFYSNRIYLMQGVILILSACNSSEKQSK